MKFFVLSSLLLVSTASFANDSINLCIGRALKAARTSLVETDGLDAKMLYDLEMQFFVNDDPQYMETRKEVEVFCRRLYYTNAEQ